MYVGAVGVGNGNGDGNGNSAAGDLAAIAALVTPFLAALGALALTGTIGRVQRNEPELIAWALFLVLLAGVLWLLAGQLGKWPLLLRSLACAAALVGFVLGLSAAVTTANDEPRPQIEASLDDDARKLTVEVKASNMETEDRLAIFIDALTRAPENPGGYGVEPVYRAYEGPDEDGNFEGTITTFLPKGRYTDVGIKAFTDETSLACDDQLTRSAALNESTRSGGKPGSGTGCVTMALVSKAGTSPAAKPKKRGGKNRRGRGGGG